LEFLGDAIIGMVAAEMLYGRYPELREGPLTRARALLVRRESLATLARKLDVGPHLRLGAGELKSGGRQRDSALADAFEAIIGAVHLDGGMDASRRCIEPLLDGKLLEVDAQHPQKDPKTRLQELLQARGLPLPEYEVRNVDGSSHAQVFTVACSVQALEVSVEGEGTSRRQAEQSAALGALEAIDD
jgi:ribonuclease III